MSNNVGTITSATSFCAAADHITFNLQTDSRCSHSVLQTQPCGSPASSAGTPRELSGTPLEWPDGPKFPGRILYWCVLLQWRLGMSAKRDEQLQHHCSSMICSITMKRCSVIVRKSHWLTNTCYASGLTLFSMARSLLEMQTKPYVSVEESLTGRTYRLENAEQVSLERLSIRPVTIIKDKIKKQSRCLVSSCPGPSTLQVMRLPSGTCKGNIETNKISSSDHRNAQQAVCSTQTYSGSPLVICMHWQRPRGCVHRSERLLEERPCLD